MSNTSLMKLFNVNTKITNGEVMYDTTTNWEYVRTTKTIATNFEFGRDSSRSTGRNEAFAIYVPHIWDQQMPAKKKQKNNSNLKNNHSRQPLLESL
jgi:hypothetical protein